MKIYFFLCLLISLEKLDVITHSREAVFGATGHSNQSNLDSRCTQNPSINAMRDVYWALIVGWSIYDFCVMDEPLAVG